MSDDPFLDDDQASMQEIKTGNAALVPIEVALNIVALPVVIAGSLLIHGLGLIRGR